MINFVTRCRALIEILTQVLLGDNVSFVIFLKWQEYLFLCEHSDSSDENFMTLVKMSKYNALDEVQQTNKQTN